MSVWLGVGVEKARLLDFLAADVARLRAAAAGNLTAPVPTCPEWTVDDLVRHVANCYLNVVVRRLRMPEEVPKQDLSGEEPLAALDRGYAVMAGEFAALDPRHSEYFWIRRMVHETAIHRVDAELALAGTATPVPEDQAVDGVAEMLTFFLAGETTLFRDEYTEHLTDWAGRWVLVTAGDSAWRVTVRPEGAEVSPLDEADAAEPAASVRGASGALLVWLYNRGDEGVSVEGDPELVARLRRLLTAVTNTG